MELSCTVAISTCFPEAAGRFWSDTSREGTYYTAKIWKKRRRRRRVSRGESVVTLTMMTSPFGWDVIVHLRESLLLHLGTSLSLDGTDRSGSLIVRDRPDDDPSTQNWSAPRWPRNQQRRCCWLEFVLWLWSSDVRVIRPSWVISSFSNNLDKIVLTGYLTRAKKVSNKC